ncbi:MAG: 2-C-methyl-D-erythritol 4-phosphate cytidylyltransferase [Elusimicrobia bacterium]|nr:2-C-methyl-D-erythritol 4-phosphate cytidylyltransferase [Elusimicrobiota bacterium]
MSVGVILVAAGRGARFAPRSERPKQFQPLGGRPLLYWPLKTFESLAAVGEIVCVAPREHVKRVEACVRHWKLRKVRSVVEGGEERADSVRRGFSALSPRADVVLIHDAARPLVTREVVGRVIAAARKTGAALAAWPVPDTVKKAKGTSRKSLVERTIPRQGLWLAQTPQGFRRRTAEKVFFQKDRRPPTDDAQWAEQAGCPVELVLGSPQNLKVTVPEDLRVCAALMKAGRR